MIRNIHTYIQGIYIYFIFLRQQGPSKSGTEGTCCMSTECTTRSCTEGTTYDSACIIPTDKGGDENE